VEDSVSRIAGKIVKNKLKMKFPTSYKEINKIFLNASDPAIAELSGDYIVDILSFLPSFKRFNHRKVMYVKGDNHMGYNVLFGKTWGSFSVSEETFRESGFLKAVRLNYNLKDNVFPIKNIRDYIRCIEEKSLYIGKFYYLVLGYPILIGYFSLEKIQ